MDDFTLKLIEKTGLQVVIAGWFAIALNLAAIVYWATRSEWLQATLQFPVVFTVFVTIRMVWIIRRREMQRHSSNDRAP
jgi:hypothetical protein